jgi:dynein heavy chain 2, cytosolic
MNTDLLKQSNVWKNELKILRDSIATLERKGYTNLHLFKLHWDYQLYKALEYQLILFLIDSKEKLPDINVDLVFRNQQLQFRPTLEEIRYEYYSQIRKYVEMPMHFHGFSDNSNQLFRVMVERNRSRFKSLYDRAERNFQRLCEFRDLWLPWVSLGCVNLENLCQVHLSSWEHWDRNFKSCKNFSQKIAKIQKSEEKIDCFVVNVAPVRSHIEFIARSFWETLSVSLRSSILEDNSTLHEYISSSLNLLQHIPSDDTGIISASFKYEKIVQDLPRMTEMLKSVQSKNTCLAGWCKESVGSLDSIITQWEKLLPLIDNHHMLLQGQLEVIKDNLLTKINTLNSDAEKFLIKWEDTLKDLESNSDIEFDVFRERKLQWVEFLERRDLLM